jgi:hypothetical protein
VDQGNVASYTYDTPVRLTKVTDDRERGGEEMSIDWSTVTPLKSYDFEDEEEERVRRLVERSTTYLNSFPWCECVDDLYIGIAIADKLLVSLVRIAPARKGIDEILWVVVGDLPSAYLVIDRAPNPACALRAYVELMTEWCDAAERGDRVDDLIPVNVPPTKEWASELRSRLTFLDEKILLPYYQDQLEDYEPY